MTDDLYKNCILCPRQCRVNRIIKTGYCGVKDKLKISRAALHFWEEPVISGMSGAGTVFFSGCNMGCVFCQNREISYHKKGQEITPDRLVEIFFELKEEGASNIDLVTCDMFIPTVSKAIRRAKDQGIDIPFIFNTSSYLEEDSVKALEGLIDVYLPDLKYIRDEDAIKYSNAPGYVQAAKKAVAEMVRQQNKCVFEKGLIKKGVIVRHLLLPGMVIQAKMIVKYLYEKYGEAIWMSLMNQYTPNGATEIHPEINRKVSESEYHSLVSYAQKLGIINAYIQTGDASGEGYIPAFDGTGV
ncbi:MAG: radical SAM protein [Lachnospiraceae bacterium]|nr:radical SAM protein [Lachnospiraceae bacterium]